MYILHTYVPSPPRLNRLSLKSWIQKPYFCFIMFGRRKFKDGEERGRIKGNRGGKRGKRNEKHRKVINYFETLANKQRRDDKEGEG